MQGRVLVRVATACALASALGAASADAAYVGGYEVRPGVPAFQFTADPGEANKLRVIPSNDVTTSVGSVITRTIMVVDRGATLRTGGEFPCQLLSAHRARCTSAQWSTMDISLGDRTNRLRMPARVQHPWAHIDAESTGNRYWLRGPNTWVTAATGDRVRFLPPGGGGVIVLGSPRLWLVDGAKESLDCRSPGEPRVFSDPLDEFGYYCTPASP